MTILEEMTTLMALCMKLNREKVYAYVMAGNHVCDVWVMGKKPDGGYRVVSYWTRHEGKNGVRWLDETHGSTCTSFDAIVRELEEMNA